MQDQSDIVMEKMIDLSTIFRSISVRSIHGKPAYVILWNGYWL